MIDYNSERPHASLGERTPAEARAEAAQHKTAACASTTTGVTTGLYLNPPEKSIVLCVD